MLPYMQMVRSSWKAGCAFQGEFAVESIFIMEEKSYWVGFNLVRGIGAVRLKRLIETFGSAEAAWQASSLEWQMQGLSPRLCERLEAVRSSGALERVWEQIQKLGIQVLTWQDAAYPKRLREIEQPPPVLYLRGEILPEDDFAVAIVGTRRVTPYGRQVTEEIASFLAAQGMTIVSGLARGVDGLAHLAALRAGGRTIAVLGSGVDQIYPPEHRQLAEKIMEQGAVISDYPPGTPPEAANFPPRNRIISGLSQAVILTEAGENSGALLTAEFAANQGREVFAVPGSIFAPQSRGCNRLIQRGAQVLLDAADLLPALALHRVDQEKTARRVLPADEMEGRILSLLAQPTHIDEISRQMQLPVEKVSATLVLMELKGLVHQTGQMHYVAAREAQQSYL
uniref:DNA protecting protein DprA n=1 Tax=uncultured Chloroflexota bacterium TaxID=166587 RepID=H5SLA2_9CHLR|nr:DNA protecting protein DprA [uncultured Chloroflexota bacterium]